MKSNWPAINLSFDSILSLIFALFTITVSIWYIYGLWKLKGMENSIFEVKDKIDNLETTIYNKVKNSGMVNQNQLDRMVARDRKPLEVQLETLKLRRQYFLDKFPLLSIFRR